MGASISYASLDVRSDVQNQIFDANGVLSGGQLILEPELDLRTRIDDSDSSFGFNLGVIFQPWLGRSWRFGAVYRRAPKCSCRTMRVTRGCRVAT